ncbi:MAG: ribosome recycling factor [Candidatus Omnitrophica bacterium]|nr:ribosome recycling factor [Candidatus Omnitrophota bacterium]MBU1128152.1 ribosome recycling factor [Candidatus Omnitrophota bacterium]MBU1784671.1 ribosome recycling factor [Candidatus Omnitrophota bacterium]MBU1851296.1 ribosome recycling factor [Candidatus Omnitrophota bacterium]
MPQTEIDKLIKDAEEKMKAAEESIRKHFLTIRTGRAHPTLVENVKVDYYGTQTPLKQLANITAPEARLIVIQPWDKGSVEAIEKAIMASDVGVTPMNDGKNIRLSMPQLTHERRDELKKALHRIAEEGKVSIRNTRHSANEKAVKLEKDNLFTEDDKFESKDKIQKLTEKYTKLIDELLEKKEEEISH